MPGLFHLSARVAGVSLLDAVRQSSQPSLNVRIVSDAHTVAAVSDHAA